MPWQRLVLDVALEVQSEAAGDPSPGEWAYDDITITVQRQAGKTTLLRPVIVHRCGSKPRVRAFMTAQKRDKARSRWMDATDDILTSVLRDDVRRKVSHSHEELRWKTNQSTLVPFAPDDEDMHGETPDLVAIDELWAFEMDRAKKLQAAYVPGFTTKNAQAWKFSTAGTSTSWWLNTSRKSGRRAVERDVRLGTAYFEWSLPDVVDGIPLDELTDEQLIQACIDHHPATGHTLRPSAVWSAWTQMDGDRSEFIRAYGNRTAEDSSSSWKVIAADTWRDRATTTPIPKTASIALGFDVDPDQREAAVSAAVRGDDGRMLPELLRRDIGVSWLAPYLLGVIQRQQPLAVAVNNAGPARDVADVLEAALKRLEEDDSYDGVVPVLLRVSASDWAAAVARHRRELREGTWTHRNHPDVTAAAKDVGLRKVGAGGGSAWEAGADPITALTSDTLAGWAFDHAPEPETPLPPFWMG